MDATEADLEALGYSDRWRALFAAEAAEGRVPARIARVDRGSVVAATVEGATRAEASARLRRDALGPQDFPAVGDWVVLDPAPSHEVALVDAVLPRASAITRGDPGETSDVQVIAANVDTVFVVHPLGDAPNVRRIERELAVAWDSGAVPVVVLTKADLAGDAQADREAVEASALGVDVLVTSAVTGAGMDGVASFATGGRTVALIGPSGAGKSTLVNALLGEDRQATGEVRASDGRGRHVTVARELVPLPSGGVLLDTPGLRAVAVVDAGEGIDAAFPDIDRLAEGCRFRDCTHTEEPGCAVLEAIESGSLDRARLDSLHKLRRESEVAAMKTDARLRNEEIRKWKIMIKSAKDHDKRKRRDGR
jgi:ribosome biogenesis GTPase